MVEAFNISSYTSSVWARHGGSRHYIVFNAPLVFRNSGDRKMGQVCSQNLYSWGSDNWLNTLECVNVITIFVNLIDKYWLIEHMYLDNIG